MECRDFGNPDQSRWVPAFAGMPRKGEVFEAPLKEDESG